MNIDDLIACLLRARSEGVDNVPVLMEDGSPVELIIPCNAEGRGPEDDYEAVADVCLASVF